MNNSQNNRILKVSNSAPAPRMSRTELDENSAELNKLAKEMNSGDNKARRKPYIEMNSGRSSSSLYSPQNIVEQPLNSDEQPSNKLSRTFTEDHKNQRNSSRNLKRRKMTQAEKDAEYYRTMSMSQGYDAMDEGVEYQLHDDRIRESNSWFIDESKEANPYEKRDDGDYLRRMDKMFLNDQKDYYQNVSLSYRFPITYMLVTAGLVFIGIPALLFVLGMIFLL